MDEFLVFLAFAALGLFLILPIASMIVLFKLRREQKSGVDELKRELHGLRLEMKDRQTAEEGRAPAEPKLKPQPKPERPPQVQPTPAEVPAPSIFLESTEPAEPTTAATGPAPGSTVSVSP